MRMTKKVVSLILAVMMVATMVVVGVGTVAAYAAGAVEYTSTSGAVSYPTSLNTLNAGTYKLLADITQTARMTQHLFASEIVFDLNGHTLTSTAPDYAFNICRGGSAASPKKFTLIDSVGGGKVVCNPAATSAIQASANYNDITIKNAVIDGNCVAILKEHQNVVIENSTINGGNDFALATNGSSTKNATITVKDSTLTSNNVAVYLPGQADVTFDNTDVTGTTALYVKGGSVEINGGTFTGTGTATEYQYNGNGCYATGDAIVIEHAGSAYNGGALPTVTINDGVFEAKDDNASAVSTPVKDSSLDAAEGFIEGGNFVGGVDASYVDAGVESITIGDVEYVGVTQDNVIMTAADLKAAAATGGKFILGDNITITGDTLTEVEYNTSHATDYRLAVNADFELVGQGYTITAGEGTEGKNLFFPTGNTVKVTLSDVTLDGGNKAKRAVVGYTASGGANTNEITLTNVTITNFKNNDDYAGAINAFGGTQLTLNDCTITGNTITVDPDWPNANGSSVWVGGAANVKVNGGTYDQMYFNGAKATAALSGGAVVDEINVDVAKKVCVTVDDATVNAVNAECGLENKPLNANQVVFTSNANVAVPDGYEVVSSSVGGKKTLAVATDVLKSNGVYIEGFQEKAVQGDADNGVRILTKVNRDFIVGAEEYGYVVAKVTDGQKTFEQGNTNFSFMKKNGGNGEKTIDCTGTYNKGIANVDNTFVTLAVNNMQDGDKVAARFYVVTGGKTYYANYVNTITYDGILATYKA